MKSIWKGKLSFGLVAIDIELYSAIQTHSMGFKLLHDTCHTPINYKHWCSHCNHEVKWSNIVKGLPLKDGTYFIMTQENIKKLKPEKSNSVDILEIVDQTSIEPIYYDAHYYVSPGKVVNKPYYLLHKALTDLKKVAIGKFVMREKEHICAIQAYKSGLLLSTLHYAYEIRNFKLFDIGATPVKIEAKELELAELFMKSLYKKKLNIADYKDTFFEQLSKRIEAAAKGVKIPKKVKAITPPKAETSLIEALKASIKNMPPKKIESIAHAKRA